MPDRERAVARLRALSAGLDSRFNILGVRVGYDALIGLIPVVGDLISAGVGLYLILEAARLGARRRTLLRMVINWGVDLGIGVTPIAGDVLDLMFRSNSANVKMLIRDLERAGRRS